MNVEKLEKTKKEIILQNINEKKHLLFCARRNFRFEGYKDFIRVNHKYILRKNPDKNWFYDIYTLNENLLDFKILEKYLFYFFKPFNAQNRLNKLYKLNQKKWISNQSSGLIYAEDLIKQNLTNQKKSKKINKKEKTNVFLKKIL